MRERRPAARRRPRAPLHARRLGERVREAAVPTSWQSESMRRRLPEEADQRRLGGEAPRAPREQHDVAGLPAARHARARPARARRSRRPASAGSRARRSRCRARRCRRRPGSRAPRPPARSPRSPARAPSAISGFSGLPKLRQSVSADRLAARARDVARRAEHRLRRPAANGSRSPGGGPCERDREPAQRRAAAAARPRRARAGARCASRRAGRTARRSTSSASRFGRVDRGARRPRPRARCSTS